MPSHSYCKQMVAQQYQWKRNQDRCSEEQSDECDEETLCMIPPKRHMVREWWFFCIKQEPLPWSESFDLEKYRQMLNDCKVQIGNVLGEWVEWTASEEEAAKTNVFARFSHVCSRHVVEHHPEWKLYWDPQQVQGLHDRISNVDARCAPHTFKTASNVVQKRFAVMFPKIFEHYWGDGLFEDDFEDSE
ncbi:unnamed protein product [Choristocarpus tenellus]